MLVAVYGSLRAGLHNSRLMSSSTPLSVEAIMGFKMYSLGSFPIVYRDTEDNGIITVEVYDVPDQDMRSLDGLEGHPNWYKRELVPTSQGDAWLYIMQDGYGDAAHVEHGDWKLYVKELQETLNY